MLRYLYSKKGFTMVELIVVIALIGILTAIFFPMMAGAGKPQEADAKAESFYRALQNIMIKYKSDNTLTDSSVDGFYKLPEDPPDDDPDNDVYVKDGEYLFVYCTATAKDNFTDVKVARIDASIVPENAYNDGLTGVSDQTLCDKLNALSSGDDEGYYYALVDGQCRVLECYWCGTDFEEVFNTYEATYVAPPIKFTGMSYIDNFCVGAFPSAYSTDGAKLFLLES